MNWFGLWVGLATLCIIGMGFAWVIWGERYFGLTWWPYVVGLGLIAILGSLFVPSSWGSALLGIFGASLVWGATELKDQAVRSELGWYPYNGGKIQAPFAKIIKKWRIPQL